MGANSNPAQGKGGWHTKLMQRRQGDWTEIQSAKGTLISFVLSQQIDTVPHRIHNPLMHPPLTGRLYLRPVTDEAGRRGTP